MISARDRLLRFQGRDKRYSGKNSPQDSSAGPSVLSVFTLGTRGEVLLHSLEQDGIFVSTGSACSSNKKRGEPRLVGHGPRRKETDEALSDSASANSILLRRWITLQTR